MDTFEYIREQRNEYRTQYVPLDDGDDFSQYLTIRQINYYWRSKYIEAAHDDIIGDYPFDNISKYRTLLEARATDFDTKHIEIEPEDGDRVTRVKAMIATKALQEYMTEEINLGRYFNDFSNTRAKYGGVISVKTEKGIFCEKWENVITDQSDIMDGTRIVRNYYTPARLSDMKDVWDNISDALRTATEFRDKDIGEVGTSDTARTQGHLIETFALQGNITKAMLKWAKAMRDGEDMTTFECEEEDEYEYVEALIVSVGVDWIESYEDDDGNKQDICKGIILYAEEQDGTHKYFARNPQTGRALGESVVESLFEHQKWHNFTKTEEMRMIAIAGKKLYVTDDPDVLANIFDDGVDHGTVLKVGDGKFLRELNQIPTGTPIYQTIRQEWDSSADKTTSSFSSKIGEEAKSGTPFRSQYLQNIEATSQFEQYREEMADHFKEIIKEWVLPDALKWASNKKNLFTLFSPQELRMIDEAIVTEEFNKEFIKRTLSGVVVTPEIALEIETKIQDGLKQSGNKRDIKEITDFIQDSSGAVKIHTSDEARNKAVYFESLSNIIALLPPEDPRRNVLIDKIMDALGIAKEELQLYMSQGVFPTPGKTPQIKTEQLNKENAAPAEVALAAV